MPQSKLKICKHCGEAFELTPGKPGWVDECMRCYTERHQPPLASVKKINYVLLVEEKVSAYYAWQNRGGFKFFHMGWIDLIAHWERAKARHQKDPEQIWARRCWEVAEALEERGRKALVAQ